MPDFAGLKLSLFYRGRFGLKHLYAHMLSFYLDQLPAPKIVFAFSNPSAAAIEVIYDRSKEKRFDVVGLVCDSGPSAAFVRSAWNLAIKVQNRQYKLMGLFAFFWSFRLHNEIRFQLKRFPKGFPILSIRGMKDPIIPPWHIEKAFKNLDRFVNVETKEFPEAGHLDACKTDPETYKEYLKTWLTKLNSA
jgi:pimeloyl-ACP methyl ester carboxylesterase